MSEEEARGDDAEAPVEDAEAPGAEAPLEAAALVEAAEPPQWQLASQIPQSSGPPGIEIIRPLTDEELQTLDAATELLGRVAATATYGRAVGLMQAFEQRHDALGRRDRPPPASALGPIAETIDAVSEALADIPVALSTEASKDLPDAEAQALREQINAIAELDDWRAATALPSVTGDRRANLVVEEGRLRLTDAALAALAQSADVSERDIAEILVEALLLAQEMVAHRILVYQELIDGHGLKVRQLAVEVQLGHPMAMAMGKPEGDETKSNVQFRPFPLDRIAVLQAALRNAAALLEERDEEDEEAEDEDESSTHDEQEGDAGDEDDDHESESDADAEDEDDDQDDDEVRSAAVPPLDFDLLIEHAARLPGEVERAWSAALDAVGQDQEHAELAARWDSVVTALATMAQSQARELQDAGVDGRMPMPGDPSVLQVLDLDGDDREQCLAASIGQLTALEAVLADRQRLLNRSGGTERLGAPEDAGWWESGAFAALRSRALALGRLSEQVDLAQARLMATGEVPPVGVPLSGSWSHRLHLADEAQARGDWEAAVLHLWLALRERAAQLAGVEVRAIPDDFEARLAADPEVMGMGEGILLLGDVARRILQGTPPQLGFSVALASILSTPIRRICSGLSLILVNAVGNVDPSGGQ